MEQTANPAFEQANSAAMTTIKDKVETSASAVQAKRNRRKRELAKLRKAKAKARNEAEASNGTGSNNDESASKKSQDELMDNLKVKLAKVELDEEEAQEHHEKKYPHLPKLPGGAPYEIKAAGSKGFGLFAIADIMQGTEILREAPIFEGCQKWFAYSAILNSFSKEKKSQILSLRGNCQCGFVPCGETKLMKIWNMNNVLVEADELGPGPCMYLAASRTNHSCVPNTSRGWTKDYQIVLQAIKHIKSGEEITTNYLGLYDSCTADRRREWLLEEWNFHCTCLACTNNFTLSEHDISSSIREEVISHPGLPVLGKRTPDEERAASEIDLWYDQILEKFTTAMDTADVDMAKNSNNDNNELETLNRVWHEKIRRLNMCASEIT